MEILQRGPGAEPGEGLGALPPEAEKHDRNFALRITLVSAYCHFYSSYVIMFVIEFSRNSHISVFQSLLYLSPTPPLCVHTSHWIYANLRIKSRAGWGATAPCPPI